MSPEPSFPQIKKELIDRVEKIEKYMADGNEQREKLSGWMKKVHTKVYGDEDANPPIEGFDDRLKRLEVERKDRGVVRDGFLTVAVGSFTMAVGAAMIWMFTTLKEAFTKGH